MNFLFRSCFFSILFVTTFSVNAVELLDFLDDFESNALKAKEQYSNSPVSVDGIVYEVGEDSRSKLYLKLYAVSNGKVKTLKCFFNEDMKGRLFELKKEDSVIIEGKCVINKGSEKVALVDCNITGGENAEKPASKNKNEDTGAVSEISKSLITIEGKKKVGTGFVSRYNNKQYVFTNIHIILSNSSIKLLSIHGNSLPIKSVILSKDRDAILLEIDQNKNVPALEIEKDMDNFQNGTPIAVYGNSMGGGVNTELSGSILGFGPKNIEITADIVPGNSGSPIISKKTGKVLGIAQSIAKVKQDLVTAKTRFAEKRKFAVRVDNINASNTISLNVEDLAALCSKFDLLSKTNQAGAKLCKAFENVVQSNVNTVTRTNSNTNTNPNSSSNATQSFKISKINPEDFDDCKNIKKLIQEWNSFENKNTIPIKTMKKILNEVSRPAQNFQTDCEFIDKMVEVQCEANKKIMQALNNKYDQYSKLSEKKSTLSK